MICRWFVQDSNCFHPEKLRQSPGPCLFKKFILNVFFFFFNTHFVFSHCAIWDMQTQCDVFLTTDCSLKAAPHHNHFGSSSVGLASVQRAQGGAAHAAVRGLVRRIATFAQRVESTFDLYLLHMIMRYPVAVRDCQNVHTPTGPS